MEKKWAERLLREGVGKREWVDFAKGAAIILIVAYHTALFLTSTGLDAAGIGRARLVLDLFPMPAFFLISGLFHARIGSWSFADLWRRRLRQYLYLYVVWSVLRFLFYLVVPNVRADGAGSAAADPVALLLILFWPISSYWFIYALFVFSVVVWLLRKAPPWVLVVIAAVVSALASAEVIDVNNVGWNRMMEYLVFFVVGVTYQRRVYDAVSAARVWQVVLLVAAFAGFAALVSAAPGVARIPGLATVGQALAVAVGFGLAAGLVLLRPLGWVNYIGVRTLNIYLVHIFVIAVLMIPLAAFPQFAMILPGRGLILIGIVTAVTIALSILITRYLTRVSWLFVYPFRGGRDRRSGKPTSSERTDSPS